MAAERAAKRAHSDVSVSYIRQPQRISARDGACATRRTRAVLNRFSASADHSVMAACARVRTGEVSGWTVSQSHGTCDPFESGLLGVRLLLLLRFPCAGRCFTAARTRTAWRPELAAVGLARCACAVGMGLPFSMIFGSTGGHCLGAYGHADSVGALSRRLAPALSSMAQAAIWWLMDIQRGVAMDFLLS